MTRTIAVFTGTRADYGLLRRLALAIEGSDEAGLVLLVSGTHLSQEHGATSDEIAQDGLKLTEIVPVWSGDDSALSAARDVGAVIPVYAEVLDRLDPDVVVVLGDRLEAFALATAAQIVGVPVAHVHGGEITEGAMDDSLRHAITKLSLVHFTSTERHRQRVIQLGEAPDRVHFVGAPIVDALDALPLLSAAEVSERFGVRLDRPTALVTYHPAALDVLPAEQLLDELLAGLDAVEGLGVIITGTNNDIGSNLVRERIQDWVRTNPDRVDYVESFGQLGYLSAMSHASVVVGNSSSTVLEAPVLGIPSVLVGDRQKGRPLAASVIVPAPDRQAIATAIRDTLVMPRGVQSDVFGGPGFAERALDILLSTELSRPTRKQFFDLERETL